MNGDAARYPADAMEDHDAFQAWLAGEPSRRRRRRPRLAEVARLPRAPRFSVLVVAAGAADLRLLARCVESVRAQTYPHWQLVLDAPGAPVDPGPPDDAAGARPPDRRVTVVRTGGGTPADRANAASLRAVGDHLAVLDPHDELAPDALAEVAAALADEPAADLAYTDEDEIDRHGRRRAPRCKPGWSPDHLLSAPYLGRLLVVRRRLFRELGGFRADAGAAYEHDLALRAGERARAVTHVAHLAYHRRADEAAGPVDEAASAAVVAAAVARRGDRADVSRGQLPGSFHVRRPIRGEPLVSVVVPFRDGADLVRRCVEGLEGTAGYPRWEALLVDNGSWEPETSAYLRRLAGHPRLRIVRHPAPFNWSVINNEAARQCRGDLLLFLNSDVEGRAPGWMREMVSHAQRPEVGAVGARLVFPDGRLQHAGVILGLGGFVAYHPFLGCPPERPGYLGLARVVRNCSAVTGACLMTRRDVFDRAGGFDESLAVAFNDVDFCLRLRALGYLVVYTPFAELVHAEGSTRGSAIDPGEVAEMVRRWERVIRGDPYFNPTLDPRRHQWALPTGPTDGDPWAPLVSSTRGPVVSWRR